MGAPRPPPPSTPPAQTLCSPGNPSAPLHLVPPLTAAPFLVIRASTPRPETHKVQAKDSPGCRKALEGTRKLRVQARQGRARPPQQQRRHVARAPQPPRRARLCAASVEEDP